MDYYDLPSKRKQIFLTALIVIFCGLALYYTKDWPNELSEETRLFFNKFGLMVVFISAVLVGVNFFWGSKVEHNKNLAEREKQRALGYIEDLISQGDFLGVDFSAPIQRNREILIVAESKLKEVEGYPAFINFCGRFSIMLLAFGSLMCLIGAG